MSSPNTKLLDLGIEHVASGAFRIYRQGLVKHFNTLLVQFSKDLKSAYGARYDLGPQVALMIEWIKRDKDFFIKQFYQIVGPNLGLGEDLADEARDDFILVQLKEIPVFRALQLHTHWAETPEETKVNIWKYVQQLWKCCVHYNEESEDSMVDRAMEVVQTKQFHDSMMSVISQVTRVSDDPHQLTSLVSDLLKSVQASSGLANLLEKKTATEEDLLKEPIADVFGVD